MNIFKRSKNAPIVVEYLGKYETFEQAVENSVGYDDAAIFEKVKRSTLAVLHGEAVFERDSFLFYEKEINYNLMMYLQKIYIENGYLNVCDWGGALGSTYMQHRELLEKMSCRWDIIEQEHFVEFGKNNIKLNGLGFLKSLGDQDNDIHYNCFLLSSVLQYLDHPEEIVKKIINEQPEYIIVERNPVSDCHHIWIENVHEPIYEAAYACCVFDRKEFVDMFCKGGKYELIDRWHSLVDGDVSIDKYHKAEFWSYIFRATN